MDQKTIFLILVGMALVTYLPRLLPALVLSSRSLHPRVEQWLGFVPTAVLSAMLAPALFLREDALCLSWDNVFLWAGIPTFFFALRTRSFFGTVALGMVLVAGSRYFFL